MSRICSAFIVLVGLFGVVTTAAAGGGVVEVSESEISEEDVPDAVQEAFEESDYADWPVVEREKVESKDHGTVYEIEVEKDGERYGLYYSSEGESLGKEDEGHDDHDE